MDKVLSGFGREKKEKVSDSDENSGTKFPGTKFPDSLSIPSFNQVNLTESYMI